MPAGSTTGSLREVCRLSLRAKSCLSGSGKKLGVHRDRPGEKSAVVRRATSSAGEEPGRNFLHKSRQISIFLASNTPTGASWSASSQARLVWVLASCSSPRRKRMDGASSAAKG